MILGKASFVDFHSELAHVFDRVTMLGLKWKYTRFDLYKQRWQKAALRTYPRTITRSEFEVERHFFEAASTVSEHLGQHRTIRTGRQIENGVKRQRITTN